LTRARLQLGFSQDTIAPWAAGVLKITIPWPALAGVINRAGPAGSFVK
jgi:hypothetical protein